MTKTPGESPGSSSVYRRPGLALTIAAMGFGVAVVLLVTYPGMRSAVTSWPPALQRLADLVVLSAPLIAAVVVAGRVAAAGIGPATGIRHWRLLDPVIGVLAALVMRALVELVAPTTGTLLGPFVTETSPDVTAGAVVLILGLVLISPVVEELFFRGLLLRALDDALRGAGRAIAAIVSVAVSAAAFTLLHALPWQGSVPTGLLVGTLAVGVGCGILTLVTGRLGAAIVAHVTYNAIGVVLLL